MNVPFCATVIMLMELDVIQIRKNASMEIVSAKQLVNLSYLTMPPNAQIVQQQPQLQYLVLI